MTHGADSDCPRRDYYYKKMTGGAYPPVTDLSLLCFSILCLQSVKYLTNTFVDTPVLVGDRIEILYAFRFEVVIFAKPLPNNFHSVGNNALFDKAIECGVERTLRHNKLIVTSCLEFVGDLVAVHILALQKIQDKQLRRALFKIF